MSKFEQLMGMASEKSSFYKPIDITIAVDDERVAEQAVQILIEFFGEDDERESVRVVSQGNEIGYLTRTDLYTFVDSTTKGVGIGDHGILPGSGEFRIIELYCPQLGCEQRLLVVSFDEDNRQYCPMHKNTAMEIRE